MRGRTAEFRDHREMHINGGDAAVGAVFLGHHEWCAIGIADQSIGGEGLTVGQGAEIGVFRAADLGGISGDLRVKCSATFFQIRKIVGGGFDEIRHFRPAAFPIGFEIFAHVLQRKLFVIGKHLVSAGTRGDFS